MFKSKKILLMSISLLALSACQTTAERTQKQDRSDEITQAIGRAAERTATSFSSNRSQSIDVAERRYKKDPEKESYALDYAIALREQDYLNRASMVLSPFARAEESNKETRVEYVAIQLALGNYSIAEEYAQKVILEDEKNADAFHYLGISLEAQSMHKEAERAFRKSLEYWEGDPTPIMNNLALNLATQGFVEESVEILEKAKTLSPDRADIERNYRIISALKETNRPSRNPTIKRTLPKKKPETPKGF